MDKLGKKDFKGWVILKEKLHNTRQPRTISEGDVWWCAVGENIGVEICGKGNLFARPVLVLRKYGRYSFMGIPLTTKEHSGSWYASFDFKNKRQTAVLVQAETISVSRLYRKIGTVPETDLVLVREALCKLIKRK
ncbi:type II toxin-antitoxin system PemK/MazF family toxin [Candidatus Saccharibacteria bacterium]|nr:type II toxin-antitoxin system PemK/MazF family toxin [Candidatus Saccharibacteria bacterium]